jgi:hypothetical protein
MNITFNYQRGNKNFNVSKFIYDRFTFRSFKARATYPLR